jgi:hypothetical protein
MQGALRGDQIGFPERRWGSLQEGHENHRFAPAVDLIPFFEQTHPQLRFFIIENGFS